MDKLQSIYYQSSYLWKRQKAIKKLKELSKENQWLLSNGCLSKLFGKYTNHLLKHVNRLHYEVTVPNEVHQFDLLYMPTDMLYGNKYKYILLSN